MVLDSLVHAKSPGATSERLTADVQSAWSISETDVGRAQRMRDEHNKEVGSILGPDTRERSQKSLEIAVEGLMKFGTKNLRNLNSFNIDALRNTEIAQKDQQPAEELKARRQKIAGYTAMCDFRLRERSWFWPGEVNFLSEIPSIRGLDLGGECLVASYQTRRDIAKSGSLVESLDGRTIDGKKVDANEKKDLLRFGERIDSRIAQIEGPQDLETAMRTIKDALTPGMSSHNAIDRGSDVKDAFDHRIHLLVRGVEAYAKNRGVEPATDQETRTLVGKLMRDRALVGLALAESKFKRNNPWKALDLLTDDRAGVLRSVDLASKFQPNHPDLPKLHKLTSDLEKRLIKSGHLTNTF